MSGAVVRKSTREAAKIAIDQPDRPHARNGDDALTTKTGRRLTFEYNRALAMLTADKKPESARVYCSHLNAWWQWCEMNERTPLPAAPTDLVEHALALRNAGMRIGTIRQRVCAVVGAAHRLAGLDDPAMSPGVREVLEQASLRNGEGSIRIGHRATAEVGELQAGRTRNAGTAKRNEQTKSSPNTIRRRAAARIASAGRAAEADRRRRASLRYLQGLVRRGQTPDAIARALNVKPVRIRHWLDRRSMPPPYLGLALIEVTSSRHRGRSPRTISGGRIAAWMTTHGSNPRAMAELLGVSQTTVTNWLRDRTSPPPFAAPALASAVRRTKRQRLRAATTEARSA